MNDPFEQVGAALQRMGVTATCGAVHDVIGQAKRFGCERAAAAIVTAIATPGTVLRKRHLLGVAAVESVSPQGLVSLIRNTEGRTDRFTWALSAMVYWHLNGELEAVS